MELEGNLLFFVPIVYSLTPCPNLPLHSKMEGP